MSFGCRCASTVGEPELDFVIKFFAGIKKPPSHDELGEAQRLCPLLANRQLSGIKSRVRALLGPPKPESVIIGICTF